MDHPPVFDVSAKLIEALNELEAQFRVDHDLDVEFEFVDPTDDNAIGDPSVGRFENSIAARLVEAGDHLLASKQLLEWREKLSGAFPIGDLARVLADFRLIKPQLRFDLVRRDLNDLEAKASRLVHVLSILIEKPPPERARAYLQRVSRCYLAGLEAETVVMCRAVLDAAFEDRIPDDLVRRHHPRRDPAQYVTLANRIETAGKASILSPELLEAARTVKDAGNHAVHSVPLSSVTPVDAMRMTANVLTALAD